MPKRTYISSILIIGHACEFAYSGIQVSRYLLKKFTGMME